MDDPRYMQGDDENPVYMVTTDDKGGVLRREQGPIGKKVSGPNYPYYTGGAYLRPEYLRQGVPRTDVERAMNHYNITEAQYLANPSMYPLPERGTGLNKGANMSGRIVNPEYLPPIQGSGREVHPEYLQKQVSWPPPMPMSVDFDNAYHFGRIASDNSGDNVRNSARRQG